MPPLVSREPSTDDLAFGFAGSRVIVRSVEPEPRASIAAALGRCRVDVGNDVGAGRAPTHTPVAVFEVGGDARQGYSLRRHVSTGQLDGGEGGMAGRDFSAGDETPLAERLNAFDLRERLVYEVTLALARGVRCWPVFHAAGLVFGGTGIVLAGVSGAGKSTLATRLLALGGELLSDELVAISPDGRKMVGFPRPVVLKDGGSALGAAWLSSRFGAAPRPEPDGAVRIVPARTVASDTAAPAPRLLVFPRYVPGAPVALRPLTRAVAIYRLLPGLMNGSAFADRGLGAVVGALGALSAHGVEYGDGEAAALALGRLIDQA